MKVYDQRSVELLEQAAHSLGNTQRARMVLQGVYALGRVDGAFEQLALTRDHMVELGIEATVTKGERK